MSEPTTSPPQTFRDALAREWTVRVTVGQVDRVRERTQVDLGTLIDGDMSALEALLRDPVKFARVLYALLERDATAKGVSAEDLLDALDGDAAEAAAEAFWGALVSFCPSRRREVLVALAAKGREARATAAAQVLAEVARLTPEQVIGAAGRDSSSGATSSPASSGSTPAG